MVGNVVRSGGVGTYRRDRQQFELLYRTSIDLLNTRHMATGAVLGKQRTTFGGQGFVDAAEQVFRPRRRLEPLQGLFDQLQVAHTDTGGVACITFERLP